MRLTKLSTALPVSEMVASYVLRAVDLSGSIVKISESMKLTSRQRRSLPDRAFALPEERKYPIFDRTHAIVAKGRALIAFREHYLTRKRYDRIVRAANRVLAKK